ncbi:Tol biopolymer transport system component [Hymenobacter luteus]|uniref:Tol biopolymer transport system component n=2 Tax=Hymenobacter TaxID=89966 RepID=A0A7W9WEH6_9BACT|nr:MULTISPECIES: PD40 domain-containing protein [Hymenobacter]MBB4602806.1 Tol biopolymer transport system component [Hymenobacter latericoloratus]MBB6060697.1 Tol biopolymer transport system component [Hymenobacter luteus]
MRHIFFLCRPDVRRPAGLAALLLGLAFSNSTAVAQTAQEPFGRVRIQYKDFNWQQLSTQNFNIYFYAGGEANARHAAEYAEKELQRITGLIGYYPYSKTTIMLFNSVGDLRQSNVGLDADKYATGGETSLVRSTKVQIAFQGQQTRFKQELSNRITRVLLNDMMYGGSLKEVIQSTYLLQLPNWFISGASAYASQGWSVEMDDYMRTMTKEYEGNRTAPFFLRNPELAGQSIWNYIAERYGYTSVQNILNLTRITRDVEVGISSSLNVPYKVFLKDWLGYYRQLNAQPQTPYLDLSKDRRIVRNNRKGTIYSQPVFSPNGQRLAYVQNDMGRYRVVVINKNGRGRDIIHRGGYKTPDQEVETRLPVLAWRSNGQLAVAEMDKGYLTLQLRDADGGIANMAARLKSLLPSFGRSTSLFAQFSQITDLSYSPDGKSLVFSGVRNGQADLYLLRAGSRTPEKLTNDVFDDVEPAFLPGGSGIVFSSNRWLDSAGTAKGSFGTVVNNYDLYLYHLDGRQQPVEVLANTISNEGRPRAISDSEILFASEESGVRSLYRLSLATKQYRPVTSFLANIEDYDYNAATGTLGLVAAEEARDYVYLYQNYQLPENLTLYKTARQETLEDRSKPAKAAVPAANRPGPTVANAAQQSQGQPATTAPETPAAPTPTATPDSVAAAPAPVPAPKSTGRINTSDYEFDEDIPASRATPTPAAKRRAAPMVALPQAAPAESIAPVGPFRYDTRFSIDNVVSSLYADPLLGLGLIGEVNMSDLMEDHRIRAGIFALTDLRTSNIFAEYTNLKHRYDWSVRYQKQAYFFDTEQGDRVRFGRHEIAPTIAYPLTHNLSVRGGPRFVNVSRRSFRDLPGSKDSNTNYLGGAGEIVFDNSIVTGVNMLQGTRMKVGMTRLYDTDGSNQDFTKIYVDLRHYQKIHRQLIWANRVSFGQYIDGGSSQPFFRLGGMDNWLNASYEDDQIISADGETPDISELPPTQMFYQQFVTNLRGFDYSKRVGQKYVLLNTELRLPIIQYFSRNPIESGFFRNLQLTAFGDMGTTYSGANPFSVNNSNNTQINPGNLGNGNSFTGTVINFADPMLYGYGAGIRTTMLGFYVKGDVAWGREQYTEKGPKVYVTLGYDF